MNEEETLAALSEEASFELTLTVEPQPPCQFPLKRKTKRTNILLGGEEPSPNEPSSDKIPSFKVTAKATIFGRDYSLFYDDILPEQVNATKQELLDRFTWFVRNTYLSKRVICTSETTQLVVDLHQ